VKLRPVAHVLGHVLVLVLVLVLGCGGGAGGGTSPDVVTDTPSADDALAPADLAGDTPAPEPLRLDLVPHARLRASATRGAAGLPWPFEARDAIATVRDGHADTGWKPPVGAPATVEIDLQPLLGRPIALGALSLGWSGAAPAAVTVALAPGCGLPVAETLPWTDPATPLDLAERAAGCVTLTLTGGADTVVGALSLASADPAANHVFQAPPAPPAGERDPASGVIEGFYGVPWSWAERHAMVRHQAALGLGAYLYAPKHDPFHRDRWREPYDEEFRREFQALTAEAETCGVALVFGISPFIDYDFAAPADDEALAAKTADFLALGATGIALLADDIEFELGTPVDGSLGAAHVDVANRLLADLGPGRPDLLFWFVPTAYSDDRADDWAGGQAYLEALAELDPRIRVLWTGPDTFAATLAAADLDRFRDATGRSPLIWDNYWANDGGDGLFGRLLLAPYGGRAADLPGAVEGIAQNLSIQGGLSRLALTTFATWRAAPAADVAVAARAAAAAAAAAEARGAAAHPDRDAALVHTLMEVFDAFDGGIPEHRALEDAVSALARALDAAPDEVPLAAARAALGWYVALAALAGEVHHSGLLPDVVDELAFPLEKVRLESEAGLWALAYLGERLAGRDGAAEDAAAAAALAASSVTRFAWGSGAVSRLRTRIRSVPVADRGFWRVPERPAAPPACRAGEPLSFRPFDGAEELLGAGLPGASVEGDRLDWTPPHAGRFDAVVVGLRSAGAVGWGVRLLSFACAP
jgi:hyaluronoglucosaminidase